MAAPRPAAVLPTQRLSTPVPLARPAASPTHTGRRTLQFHRALSAAQAPRAEHQRVQPVQQQQQGLELANGSSNGVGSSSSSNASVVQAQPAQGAAPASAAAGGGLVSHQQHASIAAASQQPGLAAASSVSLEALEASAAAEGTAAAPPAQQPLRRSGSSGGGGGLPDPAAATAAAGAAAVGAAAADAGLLYPPSERTQIRNSWNSLMRWSRYFRLREGSDAALDKLEKVVIFGGGSFGTAMGVSLARQRKNVQVTLLLRDAYLCRDINELHCNTRYLKDFALPPNINATTSAAEALAGAQFAIHAVPVQHTRAFLQGIKDLLPQSLPIISVSKGIEVGTGQLMSEVIPSVLSKKHPTVYLSGPSFAKEVMMGRPTGIVAASKDKALARTVQRLFASPSMRVNTTTDVIGVEICGSLKNVLAIAAGIVEGLDLGPNAMAALIAQGCAEIRWLATKMGAKTATISGLSGLGDIMLTCYGSLSRNRTVGVRLGRGEKLADILASSSQVAEGVPTAAVVVNLARKYRVQLPVLTAVAQVLDGHITAKQAVFEIMTLPQIEER